MAGRHAGTVQAVIGADGMLEQSHPDCRGEQRGLGISIAVTEHWTKSPGRGFSPRELDCGVSGPW